MIKKSLIVAVSMIVILTGMSGWALSEAKEKARGDVSLSKIVIKEKSNISLLYDLIDKYNSAEISNTLRTDVTPGAKSGGIEKNAIFQHPPVSERGDACLKYTTLALPVINEGDLLVMTFYMGLQDGVRFDDPANPNADGVQYSVVVNNDSIFMEKYKAKEWASRSAVLNKYAGKKVTLSLLVNPLENGNYDWALWGEPRIWLLRQGLVEKGVSDSKNITAPKYPGQIYLRSFGPAFGLVTEGEIFNLQCIVENLGKNTFKVEGGVSFTILLPEGLSLANDTAEKEIEEVEPLKEEKLLWTVQGASSGTYNVGVQISGDKVDEIVHSIPVTVYPKIPALSDKKTNGATIYENNKNLIMENKAIRLIFVKDTSGFSYYLLYLYRDSVWELEGISQPIGHVSFRLSSGEQQSLDILPDEFKILADDGKKSIVRLTKTYQDSEGANWGFAFEFSMQDNSNVITTKYTAVCDQKKDLLKFNGTTLLVGEHSFGSNKDYALFPGLEFLEAGEYSSDTLSVRAPLSHRWVPHPYKITVPLMAVLKNKCLVSLMWDTQYKWDGRNNLISARFVSPNWIDGQDNHFLGLFVPSVPMWVQENTDQAVTSYSLESNNPISIESKIALKYPAEIVDSVPVWIETYGLPEPAPKPRGFEEDINLSREAFLNTLWDPQKRNWSETITRGVRGDISSPSTGSAHLLWMNSILTKDGNLKEDIRKKVTMFADKVLQDMGPKGLGSRGSGGSGVLAWEFPFHYGYLNGGLKGAESEIKRLVGSQGKDGRWGFYIMYNVDEIKDLGKIGDAELGTCAYNANLVLKYARISGNESYLQAGLNALQFMERFSVPRGAQTWEIPLHAPDMVASARAIQAYLEAYEITKKEEYLSRAIYWAKAGLPFLYLWQEPNVPLMRYASIPAYGATYFISSWFGLPVQWCGLVYAYGIQKLSEYDHSLPWKTIAEGIVVSAMYQTFTGEGAKGCYTDAVRDYFTTFSPYAINPEDKLINIYRLLDYDPDISTEVISYDSSRLHISSGGKVQEAKTDGDNLIITLEYSGESCYTLITGLTKPVSIIKDNQPLLYVDSLEKAEEGWNYYDKDKYIFIKTKFNTQKITLMVKSIQISIPDHTMDEREKLAWDFDVDSYTEDWGNERQSFASPTVTGGTLRSSVTGFDPYLAGPEIDAPAAKFKNVEIRLKVSGGKNGWIYFQTSESPNFGSPDKHVSCRLIQDNQFHDYVIDMSKHEKWKGNILRLRVDIEPPDVPAGTQVEIDYIRLRE